MARSSASAKPEPTALPANADENGKLPEGWAGSSILSFCEIIRGVSYSKGEALAEPKQGYIPLLRANNIDEELNFDDLQYVPPNRVSEDQFLQKGDVVVAMSSGSKKVVGKAASHKGTFKGAFGAFCGVLRPDSVLDPRFFGLFFQTQNYRHLISEASAGTNINNLKREYFEALTLSFPPLAEQKRIVAKVEALLARVNAARERLAKVPPILKRFRQSVLAAACSGRLTEVWRESHPDVSTNGIVEQIRQDRRKLWEREETIKLKSRGRVATPEILSSRYRLPNEASPAFEVPESWSWATLDELTLIVGGVTKGQRRPTGTKVRQVPYLRVANVQRGFLDLTEIKSIDATEEEVRELSLCCGDILLNEGGDIDKLGRGWIWNGEIKVCIHQNHVFRARPVSQNIEPKFVSHFANTFGQQFFFDAGAQTVNLASLSMSKLRTLPIPLPPIQEQREIVRRVEKLFKLADAIGKRVADATVRANRLTQAILAKAFRGELVPTEADLARRENRPYEPAAELLKRIQAERAIANRTPGRKALKKAKK